MLHSHDTLVIAWNDKGEVVFIQSFDYPKQSKEAQKAYSFVSSSFKHYAMGAIETFTISEI